MSPSHGSPVVRERRCIELLHELESTRAVLIGGYAVSSYGYPRFSVDLDLVVSDSDAEGVREVLRREGLERGREGLGPDQLPRTFERWSDGLVDVDLLIDGVTDRRSGASFRFSVIKAGASHRTVTGRTATAAATALVAAPETLVGLKLCAGRLVDIRDLCILARTELREREIERVVSHAPPQAILWTVDRLETALGTQEFKDSLKGEFMMKERRFQECVASAEKLCAMVRKIVSLGG